MGRRSYIVANHNLPSTYNELEYVSTNGGAGFLIPSFNYGSTAGFEATLRFPTTADSEQTNILGGINQRSAYNIRFFLTRYASGATNAGKVYVDYINSSGNGVTYDCSLTNNNTFQTCKLQSTTLTKFTGSTQSVNARYSSMRTMAIGIGQRASSDSGMTSAAAHFDIKYIAIYNGTTKFAELIPAKRKSDGVVGLYNLTNSTFYSSTTGVAFTAGPIIW